MFPIYTASAQLLLLGMTVGDWVALLTLIGSVGYSLYRIGRIMSRLSDSIDTLNSITRRINDDNKARDEKLAEHDRHLQRHDEQLIKDEATLSHVIEQIENGGNNNDTKNYQHFKK